MSKSWVFWEEYIVTWWGGWLDLDGSSCEEDIVILKSSSELIWVWSVAKSQQICSPSTTMPDIDHTKSILPYKSILEAFEQDYRASDGDERFKVIDEISEDIMSEAKKMRAEVASGEELQKVCGVLPLVLLDRKSVV